MTLDVVSLFSGVGGIDLAFATGDRLDAVRSQELALAQTRVAIEQAGNAAEEIGKLGLKVTPSVANFVLIHFPETKGKTAKEADAFLTKRGLVLRQVGAYKLPNALRMSVGTEEANRLVVKALADFLDGAK